VNWPGRRAEQKLKRLERVGIISCSFKLSAFTSPTRKNHSVQYFKLADYASVDAMMQAGTDTCVYVLQPLLADATVTLVPLLKKNLKH
jgi:hypothetical protein